MNFNKHSDLLGLHAFLGASKYHWINYDEEKLVSVFKKYRAIQKGVELHDFAYRCIKLGIKLPRNKKSLNQYVNDAIGFRMTPEQVLFYSENSFGTADAISFKDNFLRIHDLKTGETTISIRQLEVYASLFCLEYNVNPFNISIELRVYQMDDILVHEPLPKDIQLIMDKIIFFDKKIDKLKTEE